MLRFRVPLPQEAVSTDQFVCRHNFVALSSTCSGSVRTRTAHGRLFRASLPVPLATLQGVTKYTGVTGTVDLRRAICADLARRKVLMNMIPCWPRNLVACRSGVDKHQAWQAGGTFIVDTGALWGTRLCVRAAEGEMQARVLRLQRFGDPEKTRRPLPSPLRSPFVNIAF